MPDRPTLAHGHLPQPGMLLRSDDTAKRGLWYVHAVAPDGTTMEVVRLPRDTMEPASAAAYYHTTSAVDDAWRIAYAPASQHP